MSRSAHWWERNPKKFDDFFQHAQIKGLATVSEINTLLPDEHLSGREIDELLELLAEIGIRIVDDPQIPPKS